MFSYGDELFKDWKTRVFFVVVEEDVQLTAERLIGRRLTEDELYQASKMVENGLSEGQGIVLETAVREAKTSSQV